MLAELTLPIHNILPFEMAIACVVDSGTVEGPSNSRGRGCKKNCISIHPSKVFSIGNRGFWRMKDENLVSMRGVKQSVN